MHALCLRGKDVLAARLRGFRLYALLFGIALVLDAIVGRAATLDFPGINDEKSYLLQARIFASGRLTAVPHPIATAFRAAHILDEDGKLASKYFPAHALSLAPGVLAGFDHLMPLLWSALLPVLACALASRLYGRSVGACAGVLTLASPMVMIYSGTLLAHTSVGFGLLVLALAIVLLLDRGGSGWALLAGLGFSLALCGRPVTALAVAAPILGWAVLRAAKSGVSRRARWLAAFVLGATPLVSFMLLFNHHVTGSALATPYARYAELRTPHDRYGFHDRVVDPVDGRDRSFTARDALVNTGLRCAKFPLWSFGFLGLLLVALVGLGRGREGEWAWLGLTGFLALVALYHFHWYSGIAFLGPNYYYESVPFLAIAIGLGLRRLWRRFGTAAPYALGLLAVMTIVIGAPEIARRVATCRDYYTTMSRIDRETRSRGIENALVLVQPYFAAPSGQLVRRPQFRNFTDNTPDFDGAIVIATPTSEDDLEAVVAYYRGRRSVYDYFYRTDTFRGVLVEHRPGAELPSDL